MISDIKRILVFWIDQVPSDVGISRVAFMDKDGINMMVVEPAVDIASGQPGGKNVC